MRKLDELLAADPRVQRPVRIQNALSAFVSANEDARTQDGRTNFCNDEFLEQGRNSAN